MTMQLKSRLGAVVLVSAAVAVPGAALAASGNSVSLKAPHKAKVGTKFTYKAKGHSSSAKNKLATFINTSLKCKASYKAEKATPFGVGEADVSLKKGSYKATFTVTPNSPGKHYICAYVVNKKSKTLAFASSKYVTKP